MSVFCVIGSAVLRAQIKATHGLVLKTQKEQNIIKYVGLILYSFIFQLLEHINILQTNRTV